MGWRVKSVGWLGLLLKRLPRKTDPGEVAWGLGGIEVAEKNNATVIDF